MIQRTREFWRKIAHVLIGSGCVFGAYLVLQQWGAQTLDCALAGVLGMLVLADVLIADYGWKLPLYHRLQRAHEERGLHAATLGFLGSIVAYKLFALPVAIAAIGMLIFGDAAAAIAGMLANVKKKRALPRTAAMLVVSVVLGWFVFGWIGAAMGVVATLAEAFVTKIDDAITIPVFAGLAGHVLMRYFL
jgi:dolichol kinase